MQLLHVIDNLGAGGPARSLLSFVKHAGQAGEEVRHTVLSLGRTVHMPLVFAAKRLGIEVLRAPDEATLVRLVEQCDVVLLHFWNTPQVWHYLAAAPAARTVVWSKVLGVALPQTINRLLVDRAARFVPTALPPVQAEGGSDTQEAASRVVPGLADFDRLANLERQDHDGFNVDYVGTLNAGKLHPDFASIMDRIDVPDMTVRVFGGTPDRWLLDAVAAASRPDRFRFPGFVEDVRKVFGTSDVFGYPLAPDTYATSDKSLQEAMYAGVPPVIFPHGGPGTFIRDGHTGIVARTAEEFRDGVEWLYRHPDRRLEMGRKAHEHARTHFDPAPHASRLMETVVLARRDTPGTLLERPGWADAGSLFLMSHGLDEADALSAVEAWKAGEQSDLDHRILQLTEKEVSLEGGLFHWYKHFAGDPAIAWWTAISLAAHGRPERAADVLDRIGAHVLSPERRAAVHSLIASARNGAPVAPHAEIAQGLRELLRR